jgi:DeoR family transcriptional regulator of aga operon
MGARDSATERTQHILQELQRGGKVSVDELAKLLGVSLTTVRRELRGLEIKGLLRRTHGGAIPVSPMLYEPFRHLSSFQEQEDRNAAEKRRIGLAAAEMVAEGETVSIGAGTTTTQVARSLISRKGITIITNSVNIAMELSHRDEISVIVTGGLLSGDWFALVGPAALTGIGEMFVDKCFVGVDGADAEHGATSNYSDQAAVHRAMIRQARQRIVVADHEKVGVVGRALIASPSEIDLILTDSGATDEAVAPFLLRGIDVRRV